MLNGTRIFYISYNERTLAANSLNSVKPARAGQRSMICLVKCSLRLGTYRLEARFKDSDPKAAPKPRKRRY